MKWEGIRYFLGLFVLAGVLTMMLALGGIIALLAIPVGSVLVYLLPLADLVIFLLGILLLLNRNPFKTLPQIQVPALRHPFMNAYVYGLLYGPIALPCSGPMVVSIFALSFTVGEAFSQLWAFLWFGLGLRRAAPDTFVSLRCAPAPVDCTASPAIAELLISLVDCSS